MSTDSGTAITGVRKAALLLLSLGEQAAADMLKHLEPEEVERIAAEIAELGNVDTESTLR